MKLTPEFITDIRRQFAGLGRIVANRPAAFLDGPAGTQVTNSVVSAMAHYLQKMNANHGGLFPTALESDAVLATAHKIFADFVGTDDPDCVFFGQNMTSLTFALSRALAKTWKHGDEIIVTMLDHDANFSPWVQAAHDAGVDVRRVRFRPEDCTLDLEELRSHLSERTRLVAVGCASNAVGTINPVKQITTWAHEVGAKVFLDAVHYAPHALLDVTAWDCDFLACSAYKFFGPHLGVMYGKRELLEELQPYKVRPATNELPGKWMTGTQSHESIAGGAAAVDYLAGLGHRLTGEAMLSRREALQAAYQAIGDYERGLIARLIAGLAEIPGVHVRGITDPKRWQERVSTLAFTHERIVPAELAERLGEEGFFTWHGNYYALNLMEQLGLEPHGMLRVGLVHYNTAEEVDSLVAAVRRM
jgi:cysteine desulfurase family protein (TIGR01976 family)